MKRLAPLFSLVISFALVGSAAAVDYGFNDALTWWRLSNDGSTVDASDSNGSPATNGTISGTLGLATAPALPGSNGQAANFDGTQNIAFSTAAGGELDTDWSGGLTSFIRLKLDNITDSMSLLNRDGYSADPRQFALENFGGGHRGWNFRVWDSGGNFAVAPASFNWDDLDPPTAGQWHDAVGLFRPGVSAEVYVDGELYTWSPTSITSLVNPSGVDVMIGRREGGGSASPMSGDVESAALWEQALEPSDVYRLSNDTATPFDRAKTWLRFSGPDAVAYNDWNKTTLASDATLVGGISAGVTPQPLPDGAPVANKWVADFPGHDIQDPDGPYLDLGLGDNDELNIDGSSGFTVFARVFVDDAQSTEFICRDGWSSSATNLERGFNMSILGGSGSGRGPVFRLYNGTNEIRLTGSEYSTSADFAGAWHDMVGVFRPGEAAEFWIDGELYASANTSWTSINTPTTIADGTSVPIYVGRRFGDGTSYGYFDGQMESMAIWAEALSPQEIEAISIPEPASAVLLLIGLLALVGRRPRG